MGMGEVWLIPALPAGAVGVRLLIGRSLPRRGDWLAILAIAGSFAILFPVLVDLLDKVDSPGFTGGGRAWDWIDFDDIHIRLGFHVDQLAIVLLALGSFA